jgi:hypothetical protein
MGVAINDAISTSNAMATRLAACLFTIERQPSLDTPSESLTQATLTSRPDDCQSI